MFCHNKYLSEVYFVVVFTHKSPITSEVGCATYFYRTLSIIPPKCIYPIVMNIYIICRIASAICHCSNRRNSHQRVIASNCNLQRPSVYFTKRYLIQTTRSVDAIPLSKKKNPKEIHSHYCRLLNVRYFRWIHNKHCVKEHGRLVII